jgi:hypothetical protein
MAMHRTRSVDDLDFQSSRKKRPTKTTKQAKSMGGDDSGSVSSVSFGSVRVREYERVIDSTNIYMGLALGWNYQETGPAPLRKEKNKVLSKSSEPQPHHHGGGDERCLKRTNGSDRYGMLLRYGYAQRELKQATREAGKFYKLRQKEAKLDAARSMVLNGSSSSATKLRQQRRPLLRSMFG